MANSIWEGFSLSPPCKVLRFLSPRGPLLLLPARSFRSCRCALLSLSSSRSLPLLVLSLCSPSHPCDIFSRRRCEVLALSPLKGPLLFVTATPSFPSPRAPSLWPLRGFFFLAIARHEVPKPSHVSIGLSIQKFFILADSSVGKNQPRRGTEKIRLLQSISAPPFTSRISPVIKEASSEARKSTASATSSGLPRRPRGIEAITSFLFSSDH